ncbi:MAG: glycoside hydrolase, partial [Betaproteobacteria bacterium]|nr:glycoside hydrolase [Betaproteobacteria bacterium]
MLPCFRRTLVAITLAILAALAAVPALAQGFTGLMSGSWWDASRAGEGQFITFEAVGTRNVAYLAYFTYTPDGVATWHVGNVDYAPGATSLAIPLVTGSGPRFGPAFRPSDLATASAGTATLEYVSCGQVRMRHSGMPGVTLNLTRLVGPLAGHPCSEPTPVAVALSGLSPFPAGCGDTGGTLYPNAEVEPSLAANPANPDHLLAMWQQDRWSNGSARGLVSAVSFDGGASWNARPMAFSRCGGGAAPNGGDFDRATDPWVSFGPDGTAWAMSLSTTGASSAPGSANAMLVARSTDGGRTWGNAVPLIADTVGFFNDKNTLTADPFDARYAYAVWDRLADAGGGPAMFARTVDAGASWEPARAIFDPGSSSQTIGNLVVVPASGELVNVALQIDQRGNTRTAWVIAMRSADRGQTWSEPVRIAVFLGIGARDPETGAVIRDGAIIPQAAAGPGGMLHVVWQDARFNSGARDGIAYSRSTDGGLTWSAPVRVNPNPAVPAFTPTVHVLADGTIGVTYFDLRDNTANRSTLPTGYFLARSTDGGTTWTETRLAGPFDLATAPNANGLFLGDYMGLAGSGTAFLSLFVRTTGSADNRNDVYFVRAAAGSAATAQGKEVPAPGSRAAPWTAQAAG